MRRTSNLFFYLSASLLIIATYYNYFVGEEYSWMKPTVLVISLVLLLAYLLNAIDRYTGMYFFSGKRKLMYKHRFSLGKTPSSWRRMLFIFSITFGFFFGSLFTFLEGGTQLSGTILLFSAFEKSLYYLWSSKQNFFSIGINEKFMAVNNGNMSLIVFKGLKAIEVKYDELYFIFSNGAVKEIHVDAVPEADKDAFATILNGIADSRGIVCKLK